MKTYMTDKQIRLVGRVWEIRHYLKMAQQKLSTDVHLLQFLSEQAGYEKRNEMSLGLMLDGEAPAAAAVAPALASHSSGSCPTSSEAASASRLHRQQLQYLPSMQDHRVIPFPSK